MDNCIFNAHCIEKMCDKSCPILAETSYLLERNGLSLSNSAMRSLPEGFTQEKVIQIITQAMGDIKSVIHKDTVVIANMLTYYAICMNWMGSRLHCDVYNLKYGNYVNLLKQSWTLKQEPIDLEYMKIWVESAKVLIISGIDYVSFNDFECQTLLSLIQNRKTESKATIIVSPNPKYLVGKSSFFNRVLDIIQPGKRGELF